MKTFRVNRNIEVVCQSLKTSYGFRHLATLMYKGNERETVKCCYYNRTWERYEFESVLEKLADETSALSEGQKKTLQKYIKDEGRVKDSLKPLKTIALVAGLGEVFGKTKKQKNDWKTRMIKAGLEGRGLIMPDDWNELNENEKEKRLNGAIAHLGG